MKTKLNQTFEMKIIKKNQKKFFKKNPISFSFRK